MIFRCLMKDLPVTTQSVGESVSCDEADVVQRRTQQQSDGSSDNYRFNQSSSSMPFENADIAQSQTRQYAADSNSNRYNQ